MPQLQDKRAVSLAAILHRMTGPRKHTAETKSMNMQARSTAALFISEYPMNLRVSVFPASLTTVSMEPRRPRLKRERRERRLRVC